METIFHNPRILVDILFALEATADSVDVAGFGSERAHHRALGALGVDISYQMSAVPSEGGYVKASHARSSIDTAVAGGAYGNGSDYLVALMSTAFNSSFLKTTGGWLGRTLPNLTLPSLTPPNLTYQ